MKENVIKNINREAIKKSETTERENEKEKEKRNKEPLLGSSHKFPAKPSGHRQRMPYWSWS